MGMGNDLIAGAVEAEGFTKGDVVVKRQGTAIGITLLQLIAIVPFAELPIKLHGGGVGGVARAEGIIFLEHFRVEFNDLIIPVIHCALLPCAWLCADKTE